MALPRFSYDPAKREKVLADRGIDLLDTRLLFDGRPAFTYASPQGGEARQTSVGELHGRLYAVVWVARDDEIRLITARRAWEKEERAFDELGLQRSIQPSRDWTQASEPKAAAEPDDGLELE